MGVESALRFIASTRSARSHALTLFAAGAAVVLLSLLAPRLARAEAPKRWDVRFRLGAGTRFRISETTLGAGNGVRDVGPGTLLLRFADVDGKPGAGTVELREFSVNTRFAVGVGMLGIRADVDTDARSWHEGAAPFAVGRFDGKRIRWNGPAQRYTARGTARCSGLLCGRFGAPPAGASRVGAAPHAVSYADFVFAPKLATFVADYTRVSETASPRQVTELRLAGTLQSTQRVE